jgi:hypothetical protein
MRKLKAGLDIVYTKIYAADSSLERSHVGLIYLGSGPGRILITSTYKRRLFIHNSSDYELLVYSKTKHLNYVYNLLMPAHSKLILIKYDMGWVTI